MIETQSCRLQLPLHDSRKMKRPRCSNARKRPFVSIHWKRNARASLRFWRRLTSSPFESARPFVASLVRPWYVSAMRNVLITGLPRSGTTLLCSLLNKLPDTVALHEPMNVWDFPKCPDASAVADVIENFCVETRTSLHEHGFAMSKHVHGKIPDNVAADQVNRAGTRLRHTEHGPVVGDKALSQNFNFAVN